MISGRALALAGSAALLFGSSACTAETGAAATDARPRIVVTYSVLGAVVADVVGSSAVVSVLMPNGANPHEWSPSAKDVETISNADLVIDNGLGLENNLRDPLNEARRKGVPIFTVADHVAIRTVRAGEGVDAADPDQAQGADDPHLWMDPLTMEQWIDPLVTELSSVGVDSAASGRRVEAALEELNTEVQAIVGRVPTAERKLVTGHESMGYFADRYGFELVGALIPALTSQAAASAGELARLSDEIRAADVPAIFAEVGTASAAVEAVASDTDTQVVELSAHALPADGTYRSFILDVATTVADALS